MLEVFSVVVNLRLQITAVVQDSMVSIPAITIVKWANKTRFDTRLLLHSTAASCLFLGRWSQSGRIPAILYDDLHVFDPDAHIELWGPLVQ